MLRDIDLDKVSDGKLYSSNDMAKTDCNGCKGCSSCCRGMGSSMGRFYENHSFQYFLQIHECPAPGKSKVKIRKWIDTPDIKRYETFIADWHYYLKPLQEYAMDFEHGENIQKLNMYILKQFYLKPYSKEGDFYQEFYERLLTAKDFLLG